MTASDTTVRTNRGIRTVQWDVASDGSSVADVDSPKLTGFLYRIRYIKDDTILYADTVDFTITHGVSGQGIWTQANVTASVAKFPRFLPDGLTGAALAALTVAEMVLLNNESINVALAQAGASKTGSFEAILLPIPGDC